MVSSRKQKEENRQEKVWAAGNRRRKAGSLNRKAALWAEEIGKGECAWILIRF